jgi:geranylgeranyl diphosphate synthase, type II
LLTPFEPLRQRVDQQTLQILDASPWPASLYDPIRYIMGTGGKRVRSLLVVLAAEALGHKAEDVIDVAVAVELLHNFTLVHDDIMDKDSVRRGYPTIHAKWDEGTAILAGDAIIGIAYRCLSHLDTPYLSALIRSFTDAVVEVCEGQALDKSFEGRSDVSLVEYEDMIARKTGSLISMSAKIAALAVGADSTKVDALELYGTRLGKAFQIQDDLLDYLSTTKELGKQVGSDLAMNKVTFVSLKARELLTGTDRERLETLLQGGLEGVDELKTLLQDGGVLDAGTHLVESLVKEAMDAVHTVVPPEQSENLRVFAEWILRRRF